MAVTINAFGLAQALGELPDDVYVVDSEGARHYFYPLSSRLLPVASSLVEKWAPAAPDPISNEAVIRCAGWLRGQPPTSMRREVIGSYETEPAVSMTGALRHSGAMALLAPWKVRRAGFIGGEVGDPTPTPPAPTPVEPVEMRMGWSDDEAIVASELDTVGTVDGTTIDDSTGSQYLGWWIPNTRDVVVYFGRPSLANGLSLVDFVGPILLTVDGTEGVFQRSREPIEDGGGGGWRARLVRW